MFTHITIGTRNLDRARAFYDQVFEPLALKRLINVEDKACGWGLDRPQFMVLYPRNGEMATVGNGHTIGINADSRTAVDAFYHRALEAGGTDAGAPGPRPFVANAYVAYVRDPDGNKICVSCTRPE